MSGQTEVAIVVLEYASPATRRVLRGAGCSHVDGSGHEWIRTTPGAPAEILHADAQRVVGEMVRLVLAGAIGGALLMPDSSRVPSGVPATVEVVAHPIELLEWLTRRREAARMHSGAKAYLYASDPDDILAKLPFHPRPEGDDPPDSVRERNGVLIAVATLVAVEGRLRRIGFGESQSLIEIDEP